MFHVLWPASMVVVGFPRIRGDVPQTATVELQLNEFSPHTRGCSRFEDRVVLNALVFPAYAGMFPGILRRLRTPGCFPRIRGDVPEAPSG